MKRDFPFKIGADPEINIYQQGWSLNAKKEIKKLFTGKKESYLGYETEGGNLGWDRWEATAELRPHPENNPMKLTSNLKKIIKTLELKRPEWELCTLSDPDPVGGHLHFEVDQETIHYPKKIERIHQLMTTYFLAIMEGESDKNTVERMQSFKTAKEMNVKIGQNCTYEFKRPNAEWLITPKIAQCTIAYNATVFYEIRNKRKKIEKQTSINKKVIAMIEEGKRKNKLIRNSIEELRKNVRTFEYYTDYKKEIEFLFDTWKVLKEKEEYNFNLSKLWKI